MNDEIYDFFDEIKDNDEFMNYFNITFIFKSYKSSRNYYYFINYLKIFIEKIKYLILIYFIIFLTQILLYFK